MTAPLSKALLILKPSALAHGSRETEVRTALRQAGFHVLHSTKVKLSLDVARELQGPGHPLDQWTGGPVLALLLAKQVDAAAALKAFLATGVAGEAQDYSSSTSPVTMKRDLRYFFPDVLEAPSTTSPDGGMEAETKLFLEASVYPILSKGLAGLCKEKPANPSVWLGNWLLENSPNKPTVV